MCSGVQESCTSRAAAGQRLPLALVGVRAEDGHPRAVAELDDELGRRPEVDGAGDDAVDALGCRSESGRRRCPCADDELLRADDRVAALAGGEPVALASTVTPASSSTVARSPFSERTVPGIRLETPMKPATKVVVGALVDLDRPAICSIDAAVHHRDPVGHRQRLLLVVGDVDEGDPDLLLDPLELDLQALAQLQVEGAERLVEEQHLRQVDDRAGERDALLLAAGELVGAPVRLAPEPDPLELGLHPLVDLGLRRRPCA